MLRFGAAVLALLLVLAACGGDDGPSADGPGADGGGEDQSAGEGSSAGESGFDESQLPEDFPTQIIPSTYDFASYAELGTTQTAAFENADPVSDTIDTYTGLLGEPDNVMDNDGDMTAQWTAGDWVISVVGSASESIIGATKITG